MNQFDPGTHFKQIVSVEMFEHMRNWRNLLGNIRVWLDFKDGFKPGGYPACS